MDDLISRQALKQAMYHEAFEADTEMQKWDGGCWIRYKLFEKIVDILPSVQPEQKIGEWVHGEFDIPHCSICGHDVMPNMVSPYCPNCGAKMEVG